MDICVIEDNPVNLRVLKGVLAAVAGWNVEAFHCPLTALAHCAETVFDLVLVDYQMPGLDGIEVIRRLRGMSGFANVPTVMITADHDRDLRIAAIRAGAT